MASTRNYLAGVGASTIFGFSFLFSKNALDTLSFYELLFFRFLTAAVVMTLLVLLGVVKVDYRNKRLLPLALTAILQPVLYFLAESAGLKLVESSTAGIILSAIPVMVTFFAALFLHERVRPVQILTTILSFSGVVVVVGFRSFGKVGGSLPGVLLIVLSMLLAALFNISSRRASRNFKPAETTFFMMWFGALVFGLLFAIERLSPGAAPLAGRITVPVVTSILYLGLLSSIVAFFFVNYNLSKLKSAEAAVFANLTTVVSVAAGLLFRGESFTLTDGLGAAMIILGVWGTNVLAKQPQAAPVAAQSPVST